jgi:hypothetical protein
MNNGDTTETIDITADADDDTTEESGESTTTEGAATTTETATEKKSRIGGRVRAFNQVAELLDAAIKSATEKDQNTAVRQSAVVESLNALHASFTTLRTPKVHQKRDGVCKVLKPYFVGWLANGERMAFSAKPAGVEFVQENGKDKILGPYSTRTLAMMVRDLGYVPSAAPEKTETPAAQ